MQNKIRTLFIASVVVLAQIAQAKEIALTFDDAPVDSSKHFHTQERSRELIRKLKSLDVPPVLIFANACKRSNAASVIQQLKLYKDAGHMIGNHTCTHPRLDEVGFEAYSKDAEKGDELLASLMPPQKFFRFPYLNESNDSKLRDQMRQWLRSHNYRNGFVSVDNDDYIFSFKINQAKDLGKTIDYENVRRLFLDHVIGAAEFYDALAVKTLGYSPKHVILLHETDATVMFVDSLVKGLRARGWTIVSAEEAYKDKLYLSQPKNTYANNGIIAQMAMEKTGERTGYKQFDQIKAELDKLLGLNVRDSKK